MPAIVDYPSVLERMQSLGLRCVYYNSGAFAPARGADVKIVGWLGPDDPTIRADLPATLIRVPEPYAASLADRFLSVWPTRIDGPAWVLPKAHWSYELDHGNHTWLPEALRRVGVDPAPLQAVANASAIAFEPAEAPALRHLLVDLLERLQGSDFAIVFPQHPHLVTIHHHKQLWFQTSDTALVESLAAPRGIA